MAQAEAVGETGGALARPRAPEWVLVLRRTMRTRGATFGMVIIALALFATFAAPLISPYDPIAQDYNAILTRPTLSTGWGPISSGATC